MRDDHIDLCGQVDFTRTEAMPLLEREAQFCFACAGCGDCCRGREDIVLSGFDLWRIAARLRLPPQIVARGYCRASIGQVSHLPVLRLAPVKENRSNCPFLTENPLCHPRCGTAGVRALPAGPGDQPGRAGKLLLAAYRLRRAGDRSPGTGLPVPLRRGPPARRWDVRWALTCMELEDEVERLEAVAQSGGCCGVHRQSCGRHCITTTTTHSPGCPSWKPTCTV